MSRDIAKRLAELELRGAPSAERFDGGRAFGPRVAVLPAAYNPPTVAHLRLLRLAANGTSMAALLTTRNVDKAVTGAGLPDRIAMLLAAREEAPELAVLSTNAARFVDQAAALRDLSPGTEFDFVAGYDTLVRIFASRYYDDMGGDLDELFAHHRLIVTNRAGAGVEAVQTFLEDRAVRPYRERIEVRELDQEAAGLSSTLVREHAARGEQLRAVPTAVADYIRRHRLYGAPGAAP